VTSKNNARIIHNFRTRTHDMITLIEYYNLNLKQKQTTRKKEIVLKNRYVIIIKKNSKFTIKAKSISEIIQFLKTHTKI